jgi:small GTP-binding protein
MHDALVKERRPIRIVVIGDSRVGKTSLINRYLKKYDFDPEESTTIGAMFDTLELSRDGSLFELQVWDTAGQEQYRSLGSTYFRNAHGAAVVFDLTVQQSFDSLSAWIQAFRSVAGRDRPAIVVGNKTDRADDRVVQWDSAADFGSDQRCQYLETSALTGEGVDVAFEALIDEIIAAGLDQVSAPPPPPPKSCC